jgi:hypothetical protein
LANKKVSDEDLDLIVKVMSNPEVLQDKGTFNKFYEASTKSIRVADLAYIVPNVIDRRLLSIMNEQAIVEEILHKKFKVTKEEFKKYTQDYQERLKKEMEKSKNTQEGTSKEEDSKEDDSKEGIPKSRVVSPENKSVDPERK